jgi:hypothetical protein
MNVIRENVTRKPGQALAVRETRSLLTHRRENRGLFRSLPVTALGQNLRGGFALIVQQNVF